MQKAKATVNDGVVSQGFVIASYWRERVRPTLRIHPSEDADYWDMTSGSILLGSIGPSKTGRWAVFSGVNQLNPGRYCTAQEEQILEATREWRAIARVGDPTMMQLHERQRQVEPDPYLYLKVEARLAAWKAIRHFYRQRRAIVRRETYFVEATIATVENAAIRTFLSGDELKQAILDFLADKARGCSGKSIANFFLQDGITPVSLQETLDDLKRQFLVYSGRSKRSNIPIYYHPAQYARRLELERWGAA